MRYLGLVLFVFLTLLGTTVHAENAWINAINLYVNSSTQKMQSYLKQPALRSHSVFTSSCRVFASAEIVGVSHDLERPGPSPLRLPLVNISHPLSTSPTSPRSNAERVAVVDEVVEVRLGPFRAEHYAADGADFTLADLASQSTVQPLLHDFQDETRHALRLHLFLGDTTDKMCVSLALYPTQEAATRQGSDGSLMVWTPSSLGTACGSKLSPAARSALGVSSPYRAAASPLQTCTLTHADAFVYTLNAADTLARGDGCHYIYELDAPKTRRMVNCTFFLKVSGRAQGVAQSDLEDGALLLAAVVTQPPLPIPTSTASSAVGTRTHAAKMTVPFPVPPDWGAWADVARRCPKVELGPEFWPVDTPACHARQQQTDEPAHQTRPTSRWVFVVTFAGSFLFPVLAVALLSLCVPRVYRLVVRKRPEKNNWRGHG